MVVNCVDVHFPCVECLYYDNKYHNRCLLFTILRIIDREYNIYGIDEGFNKLYLIFGV